MPVIQHAHSADGNMDAYQQFREVVTYGRVLGKSVSPPIRDCKVPRLLLHDRLFRDLVHANEGKRRKVPKPHHPRSTRPVERKFEAVVLGELPTQSLVNTLEWAACIPGQTSGVEADDFEVLLTLLAFLRRFCPRFSKERLDQARAEIEMRQAAKRDFEAFSRAQIQNWEEIALAEAIKIGAIEPDLPRENTPADPGQSLAPPDENPPEESVHAAETEGANPPEQEEQEIEPTGRTFWGGASASACDGQ